MDRQELAAHWNANADTWTALSREGFDVYRDALNTPAFLDMLPEVAGLEGLDLGCGEGSNTRKIAERGGRMTAADISSVFLGHARRTEDASPLGIDYHEADGRALPFAQARFDFVTAFMSLMDMPEQEKVLREIHRVLKPGGFLQFSILHPCFVPPHRRTLRDETGKVLGAEIAGYFDTVDGRIESWGFSSLPAERKSDYRPFQIPRFHRTLSWWINSLVEAGFVIRKLGEPSASEDLARAFPTVADTRVVGIFLHVLADKR